ncbi:hypothetical protein C2S53_010137 [Perilla frutescens var. hirtella]|uniref:Uncharacterized protein n=1 Tax=Perilla frutescens var. hirtella TaxID=608512 RepID=A0AAD4JCJ2_PERFH|nr:hypothetical protein C2S53_010137 [Perilla frutescens var. hirtella]
MPGNELQDRVHNFFAQDNSLQGQHPSQAVEGNWPVLNSNFWVGSHRQDNSLNSSNINYNSQNSETDRGAGSYPHHVTHGLNFTQSNLRPDFAKSQPLNEQQNLNGFMYENQFCQSRQNEANFLAMDRNSNQRHFITSKGLSVHELQQSGGTDHLSRASVRSETPETPVNFDLFGSQQQRSHQQSIIQSPLQFQQSGINNMQQLQQQLMIRKMQELHRQQQLQHLDLRQHNSNNEVNPFAKLTCSSQSSFVYGNPNSDTLHYPWAAERGTNLMNQGSPTLQGSPSGHGFSPNLGQTQRLVNLVPQQVDQSLYGVPISSSKGLSANPYSQMMMARSSMPQMPVSSSHLQGNELNLLADQVGVQNEPSISRHKVLNENTFGLVSGINTGMRNMGGLQQVNSMPRSVLQQDFLGRQEVGARPETSHETLTRYVSPQNEVALDPTEEKILFGSDDNIWDAFGNSPHVSGESGNAFDNGDLSNGLSSIQSGSWSALMQSAVAETSSSNIVPPEEWSGLILHKNDDLSRGQPPSTHNVYPIQTSLDKNIQITSALNSESFLPANDIGTAKAMGLNQFGEKFQNEPGQTMQTEISERFVQSLEESGKRPDSGPLHHLVSERSQICGESSQHSFLAETSTKTNSPTWMPGQAGTGLQPNGWNPQAAVPPQGDRVTITHEAEKLQHNFQNSEVRTMQGDMGHRNSVWNSNSVPSSVIKLGHVNSRVGNHQENQGIMNSQDASVAKSCNAQISDKASSYVENSYLLNQWKNAHPPARSQDGRSLGRLLHQANDINHVVESINSHEKGEIPRNVMENCDGKENSNDSHHSNLSQHTSGGFRESGLSDASDSQAFPTGKKKSTNHLSRKVSAPRKFHYHPMNLDEDAKPTYDLKQSTRLQAMSQQNAHFGPSKIFGQIPRNSTVKEKGQSSELHRDTSCTAKEPLHGNLSDHTPNVPLSISRTADARTSNNASLSSQNMLELLHKVDQSRNHDAMMQFRSSEYNSSSGQTEAENSDGVGRLQRSQSFVSQGFGLQLGPPSQKLQVLDHSVSSQNDQGTFSSSTAAAAAAGMGDKGHQMVPSHLFQSFPPAEETQVDFRLSRSATSGPGSNDNSFYKTPESFISAPHSGTPHSRGIVQNQQIARVSGQMPMTQHLDSFNGNASHPAQRRSSESLLPDASSSFRLDNHASSGGKYQQSRPDNVTERFRTDGASSSDQEKTSGQFAIAGISQQGNSAQQNMWTNVPKLQHNMGVQFQQVSSRIPESPLSNIVESSSASLMQGYVNSEGVANGEEQRLKESSDHPIASVNMDTVTKMIKSLGKTPSIKQLSDDSPSSSALKQKDIEALGQSLKPNSISHQNSVSQSQMEILKDGEPDSYDRASKRMRGPDKIEDTQQGGLRAGEHNEHNAAVGGSIGSSSGPQTEDCKGLGFSRPLDILQRKVSHQGNVALGDSSGLNRDVSQRFSCSNPMTSVRADQPQQVSPQLDSSWFSRYRTFSNGQMLQIHGAHQVTPIKPGETPFAKASSDLDPATPEVRGTATPSDVYQINSSHQTSSLVENGYFTSPWPPQLNITGQHQLVLKPKKQTKASPGLHPWHKEISQDSQDLWSLSMAEADWNKAANRLTQKIEDDAESIEDGRPALRSKRRLILTTHLMQQLLRPAPADVICADASHGYQNLAYHVSRTALGDACSMACRSSNLDVPCDNTDLLIAKGESPERNGCLSHAKATEELMERARKLEYDLSRLDKSASILDLRVEYQELEKFSIINRFAKFHGRGQSDNAETASIDLNANMHKYIPQRYVTALPMPKSLPDSVQCLSL